MVTANEVGVDFSQVIKENPQVARFRYFSVALPGSYFDDKRTLTQSGSDVWISGLFLPVDDRASSYSSEAIPLQQGRHNEYDAVFYVAGSIVTSGRWRVGIGSPSSTDKEFSLNEGGVREYSVAGTPVYKKLLLHRLTAGKLPGE